MATPLILCGCEPLRGMQGVRDYPHPIDARCIETALNGAFRGVRRNRYVSDGGEFPSGASVIQFTYAQTSDASGQAMIEVSNFSTGSRIVHGFTGIGAQLPQSAFPPALRAMVKANQAISQRCQLNLRGIGLKAIGQRVNALD